MLMVVSKSLESWDISKILKIKGTEVSKSRIIIMIGHIQSRRIRIRRIHIEVCIRDTKIPLGCRNYNFCCTFHNGTNINLSCRSVNQLKKLNKFCTLLLCRVTLFDTTNLTSKLLVFGKCHVQLLNSSQIRHINQCISIVPINLVLEFGQ